MAGNYGSIPYRRCALWPRASSYSKSSFFCPSTRKRYAGVFKKLQDPKTLFTCGRKATRWRKKALFSKISLFVWKGPYVASEKIFPPPNGKTVGFCFYNPKKWSLVRKSFAKGFIWMETLSRDIGFLLNSEQSLPNGSYAHWNEDFISACSIYALFDFSLEKCMYGICRN